MRRIVLGVNEQGKIDLVHDSLSAGEFATFALLIQELAMETLKNGSTGNIPEGSANGDSGGG